MIALTISDLMDADAVCLRIAELTSRKKTLGIPDAICIRNDSFSDEPFASIAELVGSLWQGDIVLESEDASNISKSSVHIMGRRPLIIGANRNNLEQFVVTASLLNCPLCISSDSEEELFDLVSEARENGVKDIVLDPMMKNMKQCLEICTDINRLSESLPEAAYPVAVRAWSGEYALTMATVSLLIDETVVIVDDLDQDCCETLSSLISAVR